MHTKIFLLVSLFGPPAITPVAVLFSLACPSLRKGSPSLFGSFLNSLYSSWGPLDLQARRDAHLRRLSLPIDPLPPKVHPQCLPSQPSPNSTPPLTTIAITTSSRTLSTTLRAVPPRISSSKRHRCSCPTWTTRCTLSTLRSTPPPSPLLLRTPPRPRRRRSTPRLPPHCATASPARSTGHKAIITNT